MIIFDKNKLDNTIILTPVEGGVNILQLHSDYTGEDVVINLGNNLSVYPSRYSYFQLSVDLMVDLIPGLYQFKHVSDDVVISQGMVKVSDVNESIINTYISDVSDTQDDYKVFRG